MGVVGQGLRQLPGGGGELVMEFVAELVQIVHIVLHQILHLTSSDTSSCCCYRLRPQICRTLYSLSPSRLTTPIKSPDWPAMAWRREPLRDSVFTPFREQAMPNISHLRDDVNCQAKNGEIREIR